ncbi:MAG: hypothetical protein PUB20_03860 [Clostridia bacterium]|nr:hypothetical protein [Clostridia bacterium]
MNSLDVIKNNVKYLYENNPKIHVNVSLTHPKICLKNEPVTIKGVYSHIFQIEENTNGSPKNHTLQYSEILTGHIEILELADNAY